MFLEALKKIWADSGFSSLTWQHGLMILIACVLIYLAIGKKFEPLLLLPMVCRILRVPTSSWVPTVSSILLLQMLLILPKAV